MVSGSCYKRHKCIYIGTLIFYLLYKIEDIFFFLLIFIYRIIYSIFVLTVCKSVRLQKTCDCEYKLFVYKKVSLSFYSSSCFLLYNHQIYALKLSLSIKPSMICVSFYMSLLQFYIYYFILFLFGYIYHRPKCSIIIQRGRNKLYAKCMG